MGEAANDDEQYEQGYVTREEIQHRARELVRRKEVSFPKKSSEKKGRDSLHQVEPTLDPHDVSWIDTGTSDEETGMQVRIANVAQKKSNSIRRGDLDFDDIAEVSAVIISFEEQWRNYSRR